MRKHSKTRLRVRVHRNEYTMKYIFRYSERMHDYRVYSHERNGTRGRAFKGPHRDAGKSVIAIAAPPARRVRREETPTC